MAHQFVLFVAFVAVARASLVPGDAPLIQSTQLVSSPIARTVVAEPYDANPQYSYGYDVQDPLTGDSHGQVETRSGDVVTGSYNLLEADGTRRVVDYTADPINGFNAVVSKQGGVVAPGLARAAPVAPISSVGAVVPTPIVRASPVAVSSPIVSSGPVYGGSPISAPLLRSVSSAPWAGSSVLSSGLSAAPWQGAPVLSSGLSGVPWQGAPVLRSGLSAAPWQGAPILPSGLSAAPWQGAPLLRSAPVW